MSDETEKNKRFFHKGSLITAMSLSDKIFLAWLMGWLWGWGVRNEWPLNHKILIQTSGFLAKLYDMHSRIVLVYGRNAKQNSLQMG